MYGFQGKETDEYRRLARSQLTSHDHAIEIGSSYGKCTEIIHLHTKGRVIGIDVSANLIEASRHEYPSVRFEKLDVLQVIRTVICVSMADDDNLCFDSTQRS